LITSGLFMIDRTRPSRHNRTVASSLPLTTTVVPSGNAPTATVSTRAMSLVCWPTGAPSASRHTRTMPA